MKFQLQITLNITSVYIGQMNCIELWSLSAALQRDRERAARGGGRAVRAGGRQGGRTDDRERGSHGAPHRAPALQERGSR